MTLTDPAQTLREVIEAQDELDQAIGLIFSSKDVGPDAREKLRNLLKFYAKKAHPFRACVRDNSKRFGPGRVEKVCATLKDMIKGTTHWRHGGHGAMAASFDGLEIPEIDDEVAGLIMSLPDEKLDKLVEAAIADET